MSKLYTAFIFEGLPGVHCTHKYLGKLNDIDRRNVENIISAAFEKHTGFPTVTFTERAYFGPQKNIPVLTPYHIDLTVDELYPALREALEPFRPEDYPRYNPHVSTEALDVIQAPIIGYALMIGKRIVRVWPENAVVEKRKVS